MDGTKCCDTKLQLRSKFPKIADSEAGKSNFAAKSLGGREIQWKDQKRPWLSRFAMR